MSNTATELVVVPAPGMTHMLSTVELAKLILKTNQLITISIHIINLPGSGDAPKVNTYLESQLRDNPYPTRLIFITFPPLSDPTVSSVGFSFITVIEHHKPLIKQAIEDRIKIGFPKPAAFVADMFCCGIMLDIGNSMLVQCYLFNTGGAASLIFILHAQSLVDDHGIDVATEFGKSGFLEDVPGFKHRVPNKVIPSGYLNKSFACDMLLNLGRKFRELKGILVNTYVELEPFANNDDKNFPPIYPVGPILELDHQRRRKSGNEEKESVLRWLDGQPKSSVVFLCFGSAGCFAEEQVKEIAKGLEKSEYRFLWTLRNPPPVGMPWTAGDNGTFLEALPEGFLDRTKHIGKVIGWAPQVEVLAHPAVGGFVSHCGWNSILESFWFGVPIATWPLALEQQLNAFELVTELELAVEIKMDYNKETNNFLVTAEEIEQGVKNLMNMDENMKGRVKKMSDESKHVLEEGGSSYKSLRRFIDEVLNDVV
ncbi:anthocyanidin 3-O-glucosyltransferase 2-like [Silene latifolia]|uniref:anthocyanidin 3-O-glucosyltransferase 2-like n=1 Tax=Silene latifolia TaxID=37657 RepID=UPI003D76D5B9